MEESKEFCTCAKDWPGPGEPVTYSYVKEGVFWCPYCKAPVKSKNGEPRRFSDLKPMTNEEVIEFLARRCDNGNGRVQRNGYP